MMKTDGLLEINNGVMYYNGYNLKDLALKYKTPLKITFLDIIRDRALNVKASFDKAIKKNNYNGNYIYLNANKANYGAREVIEAYKYSNGLEASSYYDLLFTRKIYELSNSKNKLIVSNGYKLNDYLDEIIDLNNNGYKIIDIIDSISEYEYLKEKNVKLNVGLRIHLEAQYSEEDEVVKNDRFGLTKKEYDYIINDLVNTNLNLTTIHFHQRGFDYEDDKFRINFKKAFSYYSNAKKKYDSVVNFNIGGGLPLPFNRTFDYDKWADSVIKLLKELCIESGATEPNIISENGKYSQKDSTINIYKVVGIKNTDNYPWYIVDSSLLIALPEMYALGEPIEVKPVSNLDKEMVKARLAGITCDCDDVYYLKEKGYIMLPKDSEGLYIACLGTGSYQNSMNGKGGVHHCLLPEEKDLLIYSDGNNKVFEIRKELQTIDEILDLNGFNKLKKI